MAAQMGRRPLSGNRRLLCRRLAKLSTRAGDHAKVVTGDPSLSRREGDQASFKPKPMLARA